MAGNNKAVLPDRQVTVAGRNYTLRYSVRAMAALQEHFGLKSINEVGQMLTRMGDDMGADDLAAVVWAGLRTHHPDVTKDDAMQILDDAGLGGLDAIIGQAFEAAAPEVEDEEEGGGADGARPTKSGRSKGLSRRAPS